MGPRGGGRGGAGDFVADEEVADEGAGVVGYDVVGDPLVGQGLVRGDVQDEVVGDHDGNLQARVLKRVEDGWVRVVELHALRMDGGNEGDRFSRRWKVVSELAVADSGLG